MKKIIFISNYFGNGGAARVMQVLADHLTKTSEWNIKIIAFKTDNKIYKIPQNVEYCVLKSRKKIKRIIEIRKIIKEEKEKNDEIVIISFEWFVNLYTILACSGLKKTYLIISERNDPKRCGNEKKLIRNLLYRFADKLVCQTEDAKNYFPKYIQKKTIVIPNPIKENLPNRYIGERKKYIVAFCRITKQKNLKMLIDAYKIVEKKHPEYKLEIYGDGDEKEKLIRYVKKINLEKKIEFFTFKDNIYEEILNYTMFVSTSDYEGISNSMIEAMAIGLPTICTDCPCGGARMMIKNRENGLLVPVRDTKKCANAMIEVIENKKLQNKISINGTKIKERLNAEKIAKSWMKIIEHKESKNGVY